MDDEQYRTDRSRGFVSTDAAAPNYQLSTIDCELSHPNRNSHGLESRLNHRKQTTRDRSNRNKFRGVPNVLLFAGGLAICLPKVLFAKGARPHFGPPAGEAARRGNSLRGSRIAGSVSAIAAAPNYQLSTIDCELPHPNRHRHELEFCLTPRKHTILTFSNRRKTALSAFTLEAAAIEYGALKFEVAHRARRNT